MRVAVVGGGAVGTTAAYDLARQGVDATLFERGEIGGGSTGRAAGVLYDAFAAPEDARVGERAMERFRALSGEGEFEFVETPYVWFAREGDDRTGAAIRRQVREMRANGRDVSLVGSEALARRFPDLRTDDVGTAALAENAGWTEPRTYAELMARKATAAGADLRTGVEVDVGADPARVDAAASFDAVLVAAGAHTKRLLAAADVPISIKPYRVQALTVETTHDPRLPMCYDATEGFYLRPHPDGLLAGDGTETVESDPDGWSRDADPEFREVMRERLAHRLPGLVGGTVDAWAGLCTATPDRDPLLGETVDDLYVATGWQGHGFMRSPALGELLADELLGGDGLPEFDPTRFDGDEEFDIVEGMTVEQ